MEGGQEGEVGEVGVEVEEGPEEETVECPEIGVGAAEPGGSKALEVGTKNMEEPLETEVEVGEIVTSEKEGNEVGAVNREEAGGDGVTLEEDEVGSVTLEVEERGEASLNVEGDGGATLVVEEDGGATLEVEKGEATLEEAVATDRREGATSPVGGVSGQAVEEGVVEDVVDGFLFISFTSPSTSFLTSTLVQGD